MRKLAFLIIATIISLSLFAQSSEHLTFKGIPIDGTVASFTQKLTAKGFKKISTDRGGSLLSGTFAGTDNCMVLVNAAENKDLVYAVIVVFPSVNDWRRLERDYSTLKEMLTQKYDAPAACVEEFQESYVDDDRSKLYALMMDRCVFESLFRTDNGILKLSITKEKGYGCCVVLAYIDAINTDLQAESAYDDL